MHITSPERMRNAAETLPVIRAIYSRDCPNIPRFARQSARRLSNFLIVKWKFYDKCWRNVR